MMLSVVQFDSIVQFDQFDWPYLILVPGPLGGFGAFLLWFLLYVRSWCLSSRSRVLKEYLDGWTFLSSRRSALMPDWILILALARMSRSEDAALRRFGRQMRCLVPLFWCNVLIAVGFLLPLYGVGVIVFVRQLLLDAGRADDVHVVVAVLAVCLFCTTVWVLWNLRRYARRFMGVFGSTCTLGRLFPVVFLLYVGLACVVAWLGSGGCEEKNRVTAKGHVTHLPARVDAATNDRRAVTARTDGSPRAASDRDRAMTRLMDTGGLSGEYGELMRRLHADGGRDEKTRNFAIQHLGHYARERRRRGAYDPRSREAEGIRSTLGAAVRETATTVAAPALRALADLAAFDPEVDVEALDRRLAACLADPSAALPVRVMAAQLCGERRLTAARPALARLCGDAATPTPLALAARHALREIDGK